MNESCHKYAWVMSHIWRSHVTYTNESCHAYEGVMSHIRMSHVTHMNESCHTYKWVISHIRMSHVTHTNTSYHTLISAVSSLNLYMRCLRLVGALKLEVSFAKEPYKRDDILQKRPVSIATPYHVVYIYESNSYVWRSSRVTYETGMP